MKAAAYCLILSAVLASALRAQTPSPSAVAPPPQHIQISPGAAEKLLIYKAPLACPHVEMAARIMATLVIDFALGKHGEVLHPIVISGPAMLRKPILDAVRKYKYNPYILNGKAIDVETTVSVNFDTARDCPNN